MISTCVISILRQQYLLIPSSSRTFCGLSPARTRWLKVSHLSAICLPQVKHLMGIITLLLSPVRFLFSTSCAGSTELLGFCDPLVSGDHDSVEGHEALSKFATLRPSSQCPSDGYSHRLGLTHESPAFNVDPDVDLP